jgi:biotin synthase
MHIDELIRKSREGDVLSREELVYLLGLAPDSSETFMVMAEANRLSKELSGGKAEIHAQFAINLAPCNCDCLFAGSWGRATLSN